MSVCLCVCEREIGGRTEKRENGREYPVLEEFNEGIERRTEKLTEDGDFIRVRMK